MEAVATSTRELVAHVFTPWEWQSRSTVVVLVFLAAGVMVLGPVLVLAGDSTAPVKYLTVVVGEVVAYFTWLRPAQRALRRWDATHVGPEA